MTLVAWVAVIGLWAAVSAVVVALCMLPGEADRAQDTLEFEPVAAPPVP